MPDERRTGSHPGRLRGGGHADDEHERPENYGQYEPGGGQCLNHKSRYVHPTRPAPIRQMPHPDARHQREEPGDTEPESDLTGRKAYRPR
ncbi:hypothetical protein SANTM175S_01961 [Streptomyces antimycoticus]